MGRRYALMRVTSSLLALFLCVFDRVPECAYGRKLVSLGDLHGDYENAALILKVAGVMDADGAWIGGDTVLVQTGDIVDRGPSSMRIYETLYRLQDEAPQHGGQVILLLGNHEVMNLRGDFRYVNPSECNYFGSCRARRAALLPNGTFAKTLRQRHQAVAKVDNPSWKGDGILFVHGGLLPQMAESLGATGHEAVNVLNRQVADVLEGKPGNPELLDESGPFWTRRFALDDDSEVCSDLRRSLKVFGVSRMVVGHTVQTNGQVGLRCGGRLVLADTLISSAYTGRSHKSAVVMPDMASGELYAMYPKDSDVDSGESPQLHLLSSPATFRKSNSSMFLK